MRLQEACERATDTNDSELDRPGWMLGLLTHWLSQDSLSARQYLDTGCLHTGGLRLWGEGAWRRERGERTRRESPPTQHTDTHARVHYTLTCMCSHTLTDIHIITYSLPVHTYLHTYGHSHPTHTLMHLHTLTHHIHSLIFFTRQC